MTSYNELFNALKKVIPDVEFGNIFDYNPSNTKLIGSVINIEEERLFQNKNVYLENTRPKNPTKYYMISIIFSAISKSGESDSNNYIDSLVNLESIVKAFQKINVITPEQNSNGNGVNSFSSYKVLFEQVNFKISELHNLWSILGGKYYPSVVYKFKLIPVFSEEVTTIQEINEIDLHITDSPKKEESYIIEKLNIKGNS